MRRHPRSWPGSVWSHVRLVDPAEGAFSTGKVGLCSNPQLNLASSHTGLLGEDVAKSPFNLGCDPQPSLGGGSPRWSWQQSGQPTAPGPPVPCPVRWSHREGHRFLCVLQGLMGTGWGTSTVPPPSAGRDHLQRLLTDISGPEVARGLCNQVCLPRGREGNCPSPPTVRRAALRLALYIPWPFPYINKNGGTGVRMGMG